MQPRVWICDSKKASGERLRRKLCFVCNLKEALSENCVLDVLSKLMLQPHTVNLRTPQVKAVFLDFVCCKSKEVWLCNSKEALSENCVFDVLAVCNSTEASAVIRMRPYVKAVF